jgi:hypothetical protein
VVESDDPPSAKKLAEMGRKKRQAQCVEEAQLVSRLPVITYSASGTSANRYPLFDLCDYSFQDGEIVELHPRSGSVRVDHSNSILRRHLGKQLLLKDVNS